VTEARISPAQIIVPFALITLIWGSTWIVILGQLGTVPPSWSVTYRFIVAALFMAVYVLITRASLRMGAIGHMLAISFGLLQFCINFNLVYEAERFITSGIVAVSFSLLVVCNAVLSRIFLKVPTSRRFIVGSAIAMTGVALLFYNEFRVMTADLAVVLTGLGFTLVAILSSSVANVMHASSHARAVPVASLLVWGMVYGVIANAVWSWATVGPPVLEMTFGYIAGVVYLGGIASAFAFLLYFGLIRKIGAARAAYTGVITPVIAMLFSTALENYQWTAFAVGGGVLALTGLVVALWTRQPAPRPQPFGRDG